MALHSNGENWIELACETNVEFQPTWDFIKLLFKMRFGKKMDVSKVGTILDNQKINPNEQVMDFAAKMNSNFSQLRLLIPRGQIVNIWVALADRNNAVCKGIHDNTIWHTHLQYLKYFFIAGLPKAIMHLVAAKDPATFTEAHKEATRIQDLRKGKNDNGSSSTGAIEQLSDNSFNQIKGNGTQNPYHGNYCGRGGQGRGAPRGAHQEEKSTIWLMEANPNWLVTISIRTLQNQHAVIAIFMNIVKKIVVKGSKKTNPARD